MCQMRNYIIMLIILVVKASRHVEKFCDLSADDVTKQCYIRDVIATLSHSPNQLTVDRNTNHLYFSFDAGQGEYVPGKIQIGNSTIKILKGVKDAFAMASGIDSEEIYFGGSHGIYRYRPKLTYAFVYKPTEKSLKRLAVNHLDIWWLVSKKSLYFIKFPSLNAFRYENRTITYVTQLRNHTVHQFVFDMDNNIFFINNTGLYGIQSNDDEYNAVLLREYPRFLGMATDNNGYVYLCSEDGIFIISKMIQRVKKVISIQGVLGMTFDKDNNIIYSDSHEIVRLLPVSREDFHSTRKD